MNNLFEVKFSEHTSKEIKRRILIVDDEPDVIEFLSYNFKKNGYEVEGARDGREGVNKAIAFHPDVIVADIMMPEMDGIDMCKTLKADKNLKHIPLIFLSATQDDYRILHAGISGGEEYVSKPIVFSVLLGMVENYFVSEK